MNADASYHCLSAEQLRSLLQQRLGQSATKRYARHVLKCARCAGGLARAAAGRDQRAALVPGSPLMLADRFRISEQLVDTAARAVYLAEDLRRAGGVKIEVLRPSAATAEALPLRLGRLLAVACLRRGVVHDQLTGVRALGVVDDGVFLVHHHPRGRTLERWQTEAHPSVGRLLRAYGQAAGGLAAAHQIGLVHHRVDPQRFWVSEHGGVLVGGFDLLAAAGAVPAGDGSDHRYLAPEQRAGRRGRARADQFALCAALAEALAGRRVPAGCTMDELAGLIAERRDGVPSEDVLRAIARGLRARPKDRLGSLAELCDELNDAVVGEPARGLEGGQRWGWWVAGAAALAIGLVVAGLAQSTPAGHRAAAAPGPAWPAAAPSSADIEPAPLLPMLPVAPALPIDEPMLAPRPALMFDTHTPAGRAAHQADERRRAGDGAGCLGWLRRVKRLDAKRARRADLERMGARCSMLAGHCDEGRRQYAATLSNSAAGRTAAQLERLIDQQAPTACKSPRGKAREQVRTLYRQARQAATGGSLATCRGLAGDLAGAIDRYREVATLRAMLHGSLQALTGCLVQRHRCAKARAGWERGYRLLYPERISDERWAESKARMFEASFPRCRR